MGLPTSRLLLRLLRRPHRRSSRLRIASISDKVQFGTAAHSTQISNTNYQTLGSKVSCVIPLLTFYQHMALYTTERAETIPAEVSILEEAKSISGSFIKSTKKPKVIFVLGGPGSGKGTQCSKIVERFGFLHLSAGDLLRAEINSGSENGTMIQNMIKEGKIVPSEVTVKLLQRAMDESGNDKFLIDGFPRNEENRAAFEAVTGIEPEFILFFDCPEEVMEQRLLGRNQGRVDDNIETIRKRFKVFVESSLPVIGFYQGKGKVHKVDAGKSKEQVFEDIEPLFIPFEDPLSAFHKVKITAAAEEVVC